jgi:hypothetical protein
MAWQRYQFNFQARPDLPMRSVETDPPRKGHWVLDEDGNPTSWDRWRDTGVIWYEWQLDQILMRNPRPAPKLWREPTEAEHAALNRVEKMSDPFLAAMDERKDSLQSGPT